jgi:Ni,Fe-hydrogenase III small subunit
VRVRHLNLGSCNGCDIELLAALAERPNIELVPAGESADLLLLTGALTEKNAQRLSGEVFQDGVPVLTVGTCAITQGAFESSEHPLGSELVRGAAEALDVFGCPPHPSSLLAAIAALTGREEVSDGDA